VGKFIIENIIIEKSNKDIQTGVNYEFSDGLNLISGNNEAGKSSLMKFIKEGFFREKGVDTGKIYFSADNKKYRADIKDSRNTEPRLKLYDDDNNVLSYDFILKNVNQKYFEQGFHISLDDLMNIQNKDTSVLVDTIKDPSGEKLTSFIENRKSEAKKILGENGRLTKETASILEKISILNQKINELSNKEMQYNSALNNIKTYSDEIEDLYRQEELLNIILKSEELKKKLSDLEEQYSCLKINFNEKLFNNKERYLDIIHNAGKYESDLKILEKNISKSEALNLKINTNLQHLLNTYALELSEDNLKSFVLDFSKVKQIRDLFAEIDKLDKNLISYNSNELNIKENLLKLKHELMPMSEKVENDEQIANFQDIYNTLDEGLREYNFLLSKINKVEQATIVNSGGILSNRRILILLGTLIFIAIISAVMSFLNSESVAGIFAVLMAILSSIGFISLKISGYKDKMDSERKEDKLKIDALLISLKDKVRTYYSEIDNVESSYLPFKLDSLKQEIRNKIQNASNLKDLIIKNNTETAYNNEKLEVVQAEISKINSQKNDIKEQIQRLINCDNDINIDEKIYLEVIDIIKILKSDIEEKSILIKEIQDLKSEKELILNGFNTFLLDNEINISIGEKFNDNIAILKLYNDKNTEIKKQLDILDVEIQNTRNKINKIELNEENLKQVCIINAQQQLEELKTYKEEKLNLKKEAEFQKRELESFEGLNDLKVERSILLDEYRKKISELIKNKAIISLIETAKNNFDKTQPDLKNAQKYLSILTDGKYSVINLDLEEIQNEDKTITKKWIELSRGTKEQLYLALRFGYASNYSKDKITLEPNGRFDLPFIIDDIFVNFDDKRTLNAVKCLIEFSKTNQVVFFTCHGGMIKKYLEEENAQFNIINL